MCKKLIDRVFLILLLISVGLGCSAQAPINLLPDAYQIPVKQGNLITQSMLDKLALGMTRKQVRFLLGTPLLADPFHENRWDYLYIQSGDQPSDLTTEEVANRGETIHKIELYFTNNYLTTVLGHPLKDPDLDPSYEGDQESSITIPADAPKDEETSLFDWLSN